MTDKTSSLLRDIRLNRLKTQRNDNTYLQILFILIVLLLFFFVLIWPSLVVISKDYKLIKEYSVMNDILAQKVDGLKSVEAIKNKELKNIELLNEAIPPKPDDASILENLNYLAVKNNVQISNISFGISEMGQVGTLGIELNVFGRYADVKSFLSDLNNLLRIVIVESIDMSQDTKLGKDMVELKLQAKAFYLTQKDFGTKEQ